MKAHREGNRKLGPDHGTSIGKNVVCTLECGRWEMRNKRCVMFILLEVCVRGLRTQPPSSAVRVSE